MRSGIIVLLLLFFGATGITFAESTVDLDAPGAIAELARDRPAHYKRVVEELSKPQTFHFNPVPASLESRVLVEVDGITYGVTLRATRDPEELKKTK